MLCGWVFIAWLVNVTILLSWSFHSRGNGKFWDLPFISLLCTCIQAYFFLFLPFRVISLCPNTLLWPWYRISKNFFVVFYRYTQETLKNGGFDDAFVVLSSPSKHIMSLAIKRIQKDSKQNNRVDVEADQLLLLSEHYGLLHFCEQQRCLVKSRHLINQLLIMCFW